jgi:hypothetical protein
VTWSVAFIAAVSSRHRAHAQRERGRVSRAAGGSVECMTPNRS